MLGNSILIRGIAEQLNVIADNPGSPGRKIALTVISSAMRGRKTILENRDTSTIPRYYPFVKHR